MGNKEVLNLLNERTRQLINDMFSFIDFFMEKEVIASIKDNGEVYNYPLYNEEKLSKEVIAYALLLSSMKNDEIIKKFFNKYDVNYNSLLSNFDVEGSFLSTYINENGFEFKDAKDANTLKYINLNETFKNILVKLKYTTFLENETVNMDLIEPYHIFDYLMDKFPEAVRELLNTHMSFNKEVNDELVKYLHKHYSEFAASFNINLDIKTEDEIKNRIRYNYKSCDIYEEDKQYYLFIKEDAPLEQMIKSISKIDKDDSSKYCNKKTFIDGLTLPTTFQILSVDNKPVTKNLIVRLSTVTKKNTYSFKIKNLNTNNIYTIVIDKYKTFKTFENKDSFERHSDFISDLHDHQNSSHEKIKLYTPSLDKYGFDLTKSKYIKDPSIGRDSDIRKIEQILSYPERDKSIIITGAAGAGKTALVKGLAYRIQNGNVPNHLKDLKIISIDVATLVAGTKYVGTLEEKMKSILEEASSSKDIILFIDEIHQAIGAGSSDKDSNSVAEILKPYLDYGRARVIGATTTDEYLEYLDTDQAFKTRFKRVVLNEPDESIIYQILDDLITAYNSLNERSDYYCPKLILDDSQKTEVIKWLIKVTDKRFRNYQDRASNPRLVLDIIKEAYAIAAMRNSDTVSLEDIAEALLAEERLYKNYKERMILELLNIKPTDIIDNIINFSLVKK